MDLGMPRTVGEAAPLLASGELSSTELVSAVISDLEANGDQYRVVALELFERAIEQAGRADAEIAAGTATGPLHGVPFGVKDLYDIAGFETAAGSTVLAGNIASTTATAVAKLESAGAIPVAKLAMTEFAGAVHHRTIPAPVNPYDPDRSPAGSSSGSGVAVAARLVPFALGSDTVASIRLPAAWNGCVGFKPSYGRVSRHGVVPLAATFDHCGPLSLTVDDAAAVTRAMAGPDDFDGTTRRDTLVPVEHPDLAGLRVGYDDDLVSSLCMPAVAACSRAAVDLLGDGGAQIAATAVPLRHEAGSHYYAQLRAEIAYAHRSTWPARRDDYTPSFAAILDSASEVTPHDLVAAAEFRIAFGRAIEALFTQIDVLVMPTAPINAVPGGAGTDADPFDMSAIDMLPLTWLWNLSGAPAVSLPWGLDADGVANSVQVIAAPGADNMVLAVASLLEGLAPETPPPTGR